jgi:hypothetical protein
MKKHPNKQIRAAIEAAEQAGWQVVGAGKSAHCFCKLRCGTPEHSEHTMSIWSTPKSPEEHAKTILRKIKQCAP